MASKPIAKPKATIGRINAVLAAYDLLPGWKPEDFQCVEQSPEDQIPELERLLDAANKLNVMFSRVGVERFEIEVFELYHKMWDDIAQRLLGTGLHLVLARRPKARVS